MNYRDLPVTLETFDAVLFDLDGVLTSTAGVHAACWKRTFDAFLRLRACRTGEPFQPFGVETDYKLYVDGRPRYEGVRNFLASRGIRLPEGNLNAPPGEASVAGLGNLKDRAVKEAIRAGGVRVYPGAVAWVQWLRGQGLRTAVVSSSRNCAEVLWAAGISVLFEAQVDGGLISRLGLPGKPAPDSFLMAAELVEALPGRAVVVEDALVGVKAGQGGGFGLVVGVDHGGQRDALLREGADLVVEELSEPVPDPVAPTGQRYA